LISNHDLQRAFCQHTPSQGRSSLRLRACASAWKSKIPAAHSGKANGRSVFGALLPFRVKATGLGLSIVGEICRGPPGPRSACTRASSVGLAGCRYAFPPDQSHLRHACLQARLPPAAALITFRPGGGAAKHACCISRLKCDGAFICNAIAWRWPASSPFAEHQPCALHAGA